MAVVIPGSLGKFKIGTSTAAEVLNVKKIELTGVSQDGIDTYVLSSTAKTQRASKLTDFGSCKVEFYYDNTDTVHQAVRAGSSNGLMHNWEITLPVTPAAPITGSGFISSFEITGIEPDGNITVSIEVKNNSVVHS